MQLTTGADSLNVCIRLSHLRFDVNLICTIPLRQDPVITQHNLTLLLPASAALAVPSAQDDLPSGSFS